MNVSATGIPVVWTNARNARLACVRIAPLPARITGFRRPRMISVARWSSSRARLGLNRGVARQRRCVERAAHHVLGQLEMGGSGLLGLRYLERLAYHLGHDLRARNPCIPLYDRPHDAD